MSGPKTNIVMNVAGFPAADPCDNLRDTLELASRIRISVLCQVARNDGKGLNYTISADPGEPLADCCKRNSIEWRPDSRNHTDREKDDQEGDGMHVVHETKKDK